MKDFFHLREATSGRKDVKCSGEKSQFGGYTPTCTRNGKGVYSAQHSYKDKATAKKHAEVYADAYYSMGDRAAQNATRKFVAQNKDKLHTKKESVEEGYKSPAEAQAIADGKKAARQGKKYSDNPHKKGSKEFTAWSKGHNMARESVEESKKSHPQGSAHFYRGAMDKYKAKTPPPLFKTDEFEVKYAKSKRGPIKVTKFKDLESAKKFLAQKRKEGMNGIISKGGKPVKEKYRKPTAAEIEADKKKDRRGKSRPSASYKSIRNKMYKNAMGGLKDD